MAVYLPTLWVNDQAPALSAANLNKLTDELAAQAVTKGILHTLPAWTDDAAPALTDAAPLNEMDRVAAAVASALGLSYTPTTWESGWTPARNAARFNALEQQAKANRDAIDSPVEGYYWNENWEAGVVPPGWSTEQSHFGSSSFQGYDHALYDFVADPFGANQGTMLRLRCLYDDAFPTDDRTLVSLYLTANTAHSGYQMAAEETWYRVKLGWLADNVFASAQSNFTVEWHTDSDTQSQGGNSPALMVRCDFPAYQPGINPKIHVVWRSGSPSSPTETWWPSIDGSGAFIQRQGIVPAFGHVYDMVWHVIWSSSSSVGLMEWWVDEVLQVSKQMATLYTNPNLAPFNQAYMTFGLYNYRYNVVGDAATYFGDTLIGPSAASIGFTP
jgi:hypothetical protein